MNEIFSIEKLREMANPIIQIPSFDNKGYINIKVQRPKLLDMAVQGRIPNHLIGIAQTVIGGKKKGTETLSDEKYIEQINNTMELYCVACMVEPTFEEMKDILTDDQKATIFKWGIGEVQSLNSFRNEEGNGTSDNNGETLPKKTE